MDTTRYIERISSHNAGCRWRGDASGHGRGRTRFLPILVILLGALLAWINIILLDRSLWRWLSKPLVDLGLTHRSPGHWQNVTATGRGVGGKSLELNQREPSMKLEESVDRTVSLIVSLWAEDIPETEKPSATSSHPHRIEIEAALVANLNNPYISQLVVVLDRVTPHSNCTHFKRRMNHLLNRHRIGTMSHPTVLTCIPTDKQPTYLEMFQYTQRRDVSGRVVLVANADHAFDDTLETAAYLKPSTLLVLTSRGYQIDPKYFTKRRPRHMINPNHTATTPQLHRQLYLNMTGFAEHPPIDDRCGSYIAKSGQISKDPVSWDSYIFERRLLEGKLNSSHFRRDSFGHYYMNSGGAENAASYDLAEALGGNHAGVSVWNACYWIHSFHFHFAEKMHRGGSMRVPKPYLIPKLLTVDNFTSAFDLKHIS